MSKNASLANGEAMPSLNRRRMLLGLAAATSGAAVLAVTAAGEAKADAPTENPKLLALADELPGVVAEFDAARVRLDTAIAVGRALWPVADGDVLAKGFEPGWDYERDILGERIIRDGEERKVVRASFVADAVGNLRKSLTVRKGKALVSIQRMHDAQTKRLAILQEYERRVEAARKSSNYDEALARFRAADEALADLVKRIMHEPARSLTGVVIKAEALQAWGSVTLLTRTLRILKDDWTAAFAGELLAIAGAGAEG